MAQIIFNIRSHDSIDDKYKPIVLENRITEDKH